MGAADRPLRVREGAVPRRGPGPRLVCGRQRGSAEALPVHGDHWRRVEDLSESQDSIRALGSAHRAVRQGRPTTTEETTMSNDSKNAPAPVPAAKPPEKL